LGVLLAVVLAVAIVGPALTQETGEPADWDSGDVGREMALSAGCDISQAGVAMNEATYDYAAGAGVATVEEAVLGMAQGLARDGVAFSIGELEAAVAAADLDTNPIEVRLPVASISIERTSEGKYLVRERIVCA
jgi:hypothetical protein